MKRILLTAFEPFGGETINPSQKIVEAIKNLQFNGGELEVLLLPVERQLSVDLTLHGICSLSPDFVIMLGQAGRRAQITPERVALNFDAYSNIENQEDLLEGQAIHLEGPVGYFSTLPICKITKQLLENQIPTKISETAGTYICNRLFYSVMHHIAINQLSTKAGFIHVPFLHEQAIAKGLDCPSLSLKTMVEGVQLVIQVALGED